jgi:hypothetical protein
LYHTAEALRCLSELAAIIPVDEAPVERTVQWLLDQQSSQGTWTLANIPPSWQSLPRAELPGTAYVAWSLIEAGYRDAPEVRLAVEHLARYPDKAHDPYVLALMARALLAHAQAQPDQSFDEALDEVLARLAESAEVVEDAAGWYGEIKTLSGAIGEAADVERTAWAVRALLEAGSHPTLAVQGLAWLAAQRDEPGLWGSPNTNWLAARTLGSAVPPESSLGRATVYVSAAESDLRAIEVRSRERGAAPRLTFDELAKGYNDILLSAEGLGRVPYRIVGTYVLPWDQIEPPLPAQEAISITVGYDRTEVIVGETITSTVGVTSDRLDVISLAVLELGLPPGLALDEREWDEWVESGAIARYRRDGERMIVYLADLSPEEPTQLVYHLQARFPLSVQTLPTRAYDAANPRAVSVQEPVRITVLAEPSD